MPTPRTIERRSRMADAPIGRVMHAGFVSCPLETPITTVARLLAEHRVHCVVGFSDATEGDTAVWGLISDIDVVAALATGHHGLSAGEIAATEVVTVTAVDSVRHAAMLMRDHAVSHLLVVDGLSDRPVGIVSTLDIAAHMSGAAVRKLVTEAAR